MSKKDVLAINDFASIVARQTRSKKTGKLGKARITMEIDAQPVLFDLQDPKLLKEVAERQTHLIKSKLSGGGAPVPKKTAQEREVMENAYWANKKWAERRFSGGKMRHTPPRPGERNLFFHSGRLHQSIKSRYVKKTKSWVINVAANRLQQSSFGTHQQYQNFLNKLLGHVPLLDARRYVKSSEYHRNLDKWIDRSVRVLKRNSELKAARRKAIAGALKGLGKLVL